MSEILGKVAEAPLSRRFAWVTATRLCILAFLLGLIALVNLKGSVRPDSFTTQLGSVTLAAGFAFTALTAYLSRRSEHLPALVNTHLCFDQAIWTVIVYLSGGAASGATSFYGLTCLAGALLNGTRGALSAALAGALCFCSLLLCLGVGLIPMPPDQPASAYAMSPGELVASGAINLLAILVVMLLAGTLSERLKLAGGRLLVAEQRASKAERLAALGTVAASLAHEIRNPLGSIAGSIRLLGTNSAFSAEERQLCDIIVRETARLKDLVSDMLDLSSPRQPVFEVVDVAAVAREVVQLAEPKGSITEQPLVSYAGVGHAFVRADPSHLRQLIWNLVRNGVQATAAGGHVEVSVEVGRGGVRLRVSDDGPGLDEEAKSMIFDAFFTTRSKGTGIGLAVVKRIADEHGFEVVVDSTEGAGAIFEVALGREQRSNSGALLSPLGSEPTFLG